MQRIIDVWHSPRLNQPMEIATYGHYGFPLLLFPTAAADYLEYERFLLIDAIAEHVDAGKVKVFSINSINREAWMNRGLHPRDRALRQQQFNGYVTEESYRAFYTGVVEDIRAYLSGEPIRVINPEVLTSPQLRRAG